MCVSYVSFPSSVYDSKYVLCWLRHFEWTHKRTHPAHHGKTRGHRHGYQLCHRGQRQSPQTQRNKLCPSLFPRVGVAGGWRPSTPWGRRRAGLLNSSTGVGEMSTSPDLRERPRKSNQVPSKRDKLIVSYHDHPANDKLN